MTRLLTEDARAELDPRRMWMNTRQAERAAAWHLGRGWKLRGYQAREGRP